MNEDSIEAALATGERMEQEGVKVAEDGGLKAELEKAKHSADVWRGHATKRADRIKELEEKLRKYETKEQVAAAIAEIPDDLKGDTPDEMLAASLAGSQKLMEASNGKTMEEIEKVRKEIADNNKRQFVRQLGANHGRFLEMVGPGGANEKLWQQFKQVNRETYESVVNSQDVDRFGVLVNQFCSQFGLKNPSGGQANTTASSPASVNGGYQNQPGFEDKTEYTTSEYLKQLESAEDARNSGDMKSYREITGRLTKALNEGRVRDN